MLSKEEFVNIINDLEDLYNKQDNLCKAMEDLSPDFHVDFYPLTKIIDICIDLLNSIFNQDTEDSIIGYYIFETNWGKDADEYYITEEDGTEYKLRNPEDLYNYLIKDIK